MNFLIDTHKRRTAAGRRLKRPSKKAKSTEARQQAEQVLGWIWSWLSRPVASVWKKRKRKKATNIVKM
jgi:hypothetical protein